MSVSAPTYIENSQVLKIGTECQIHSHSLINLESDLKPYFAYFRFCSAACVQTVYHLRTVSSFVKYKREGGQMFISLKVKN